jgi:hypothetical protein
MESKKESVIELHDMALKPPAIESRFATASGQTKADNANLTIDGSKRYTLQTLEVLAGGKVGDVSDHRIEEAFPWHELKANGLWLSRERLGDNGPKSKLRIEWHPHRDHHKPALPLPFTVYEFAAFLFHGGGDQFLLEEFGGCPICEKELTKLGANSSVEVQLLQACCELIALATNRFGSPDAGVNEDAITEAVKWLLAKKDAGPPKATNSLVTAIPSEPATHTNGDDWRQEPEAARQLIKQANIARPVQLADDADEETKDFWRKFEQDRQKELAADAKRTAEGYHYIFEVAKDLGQQRELGDRAFGNLMLTAANLHTRHRDIKPSVIEQRRLLAHNPYTRFQPQDDELVNAAWLVTRASVNDWLDREKVGYRWGELPEQVTIAEPQGKPKAAEPETSELNSRTLTTPQVSDAFDGVLGFTSMQWKRKLGDVNNHKWLLPARITLGAQPKPSTWCPLKLAELVSEKDMDDSALRRAFLEKQTLKSWLLQWQEQRRQRNAFGQ